MLDLQGARTITSITLEIDAAGDGIATGWINWLGLQHAELLNQYKEQWLKRGRGWETYLKPESYEPTFVPEQGLMFDVERLEQMRQLHADYVSRHGDSHFLTAAREAAKMTPELMVRDFVNFWNDTRYCRERDQDNILLDHGPSAAFAGLLQKDKNLLRLGARYALALAFSGQWDDGMICEFPGGIFNHRCFVASLALHDLGMILDMAGEMFTDVGRDYIRRRIAEEGLASVTYNTWKYEYIFHCNQLIWFSPGRMIGQALWERISPRAKAYTDIALQEIFESMELSILTDGSYVEGPNYFMWTARQTGISLHYYKRLRGVPIEVRLPERFKRTADFGEALLSTDTEQDYIPICDSPSVGKQEGLAMLARLLPGSAWGNIYRKAVLRGGGLPNHPFAFIVDSDIELEDAPIRPFVTLSDMGIMASHRKWQGESVKLFIMGNKSGAGHTHEDKGSFVLEFAGETFAKDPGTCDYSSPFALLLQQCERHNMLVPTGTAGRPHPLSPLPVDVKPQGTGDAIGLQAQIDATPGWGGYYKRWSRTWESPVPETLRIVDDYELESGDAVEFYWNTDKEAVVNGNTIVLRGIRGTATIQVPADCQVRIDHLPMLDREQQRIAIRKEGVQGRIVVDVRLSVNVPTP